MRHRRLAAIVLVWSAALLARVPPAVAEPPATPASATGVVRGTVTFTGTAPAPARLDNGSDPFCARTRVKAEDLLVGPGGALRNVLVRVAGVPGRYAPPAEPAVIDQLGCVYRPHVQGVVAGQSIRIKNSDNTLHNVHTYRGAETVFNLSQIPYATPTDRKLPSSEGPIRFGCDMHPWMSAFVVVSAHPFFAVTGPDGAFTIPGVPAGTYKLEAWHEKLGVRTVDVTVTAGGAATTAIAYEAPPGAAPGAR